MSSMVFPWVCAAPNWQVAQKWWDVASKIRRLWLPFCPTLPRLSSFAVNCSMELSTWPGTRAASSPQSARNWGSQSNSPEGAESCQQPYKGDWEQILPQVKRESDCTLTSTLTTACQGAQLSHMQVPNSQRLWNSKWLLFSTTEFRDNLLCSKR